MQRFKPTSMTNYRPRIQLPDHGPDHAVMLPLNNQCSKITTLQEFFFSLPYTLFDACAGLCSMEHWREPSALKLWNLGAQHMICMKKLRFPSHPRAKVRRQRPPGSARAQPCCGAIFTIRKISLTKYFKVKVIFYYFGIKLLSGLTADQCTELRAETGQSLTQCCCLILTHWSHRSMGKEPLGVTWIQRYRFQGKASYHRPVFKPG